MTPEHQIERVAVDLSNRLRGRYAKGPIMADGEPEFGWAIFNQMPDGSPFPGIHAEAAAFIEALLSAYREKGDGVSYAAQSDASCAPVTLDLAKLEEVARAATQGEWLLGEGTDMGGDGVWWITAPVPSPPYPRTDIVRANHRMEDSLHIATFDPPTCLALLAEIKRLRTAR